MVYQTFTQATKARGARTVEVIDLGFFPWTALREGLLKEPVERKTSNYRPLSDYIKNHTADADLFYGANPQDRYESWEAWLQDWRVELNAMTTAEFVAWMNVQFEKHGAAKTVPPEELALSSVTEIVRAKVLQAADGEMRARHQEDLDALQQLMDELEDQIAEEADQLAEERLDAIEFPEGAVVVEEIKKWLKRSPPSHWRYSIDHVATELIPEDERPEPEDEEGERDGEGRASMSSSLVVSHWRAIPCSQ
jgi:hypothetical protein